MKTCSSTVSLLALACTACASLPESEALHEEPYFRTGSHIPVHDSAYSTDVTSYGAATPDALPPNMKRPAGVVSN